MSTVNVNEAWIHYEKIGSGHPLMLISGYTCDRTVWMPIVDLLAEHFQVILFDNRGCGRTKDEGKALSVELLAEDVRELARVLELHKPHIIGQSMGGTIAQQFAFSYPTEIGKLGLLVTTAKWRGAMLMALRSHLALRKEGVSPDILFENTMAWVFGERFLADLRKMGELKRLMFANPYPQSVVDQARQFRVLEEFDGRPHLKKIQAPTLVMYGKEDLLSLPRESEFLAKQIPNAQIGAFDTGHGLILEDPEWLAKAIIRFFKN